MFKVFTLTSDQRSKFSAWKVDQDSKVADAQRVDRPDFEKWGLPYYGSIGSGYTYMFTPSSLGTMLRVRNNVTGDEIDLSEYDSF